MLLLTASNYWGTLFSAQQHKPGQGNWARYGTFAAGGAMVVYGIYSWQVTHGSASIQTRWILPLVVAAACAWALYRLVHFPKFADFLINTESEMNKVSWPSATEVKVSTVVVLINVMILATFLFAVDLFWQVVLNGLGILKIISLLRGGITG